MQQNNGAPDRRILGFTKMVTLMATYKKHVPLTLRQEIQVNRMSNELREALDDKSRQVPLFISWLKWAISNYKNVVLRDKEHQATVLRYLAIIEAVEATGTVSENLALQTVKFELLFVKDVPEKFEEWMHSCTETHGTLGSQHQSELHLICFAR